MVGRKVIETITLNDRVWINCEGRFVECAIYVERTEEAESVSPGDSLWWQSNWAYWTAYDGELAVGKEDVKIPRIGFSGVPRPELN